MKEKILALLLAKFAGVRKDGLAQLAASLGLTVTTEEEANTIVGKLTAENVNAFVTDWRKEVDAETSKATKTYEEGLKKKFEFVEKKEPPPTPTPPDPNEPEWFKAYRQKQETAQIELQKKIDQFENAKKFEQLESIAKTKLKEKGIPESFVSTINIESEDKIDEFVAAQEARFTAFKQEQINSGNWVDKPTSGISGGGEKSVEDYVKIMEGGAGNNKSGTIDLGVSKNE